MNTPAPPPDSPEKDAPPRLATLFSDHMVLQREHPLPVWGSGSPGTGIEVRLGDRTLTTRVEADGRWQVGFPPGEAAAGLTLEVSDGTTRLICSDVCIGDVWLCAGQSNMEWPLELSDGGEQELRAPPPEHMRVLLIPSTPHPVGEATGISAVWRRCGPESLARFSGVGYFFGRVLERTLGVPVGLICAAVGGTPIASWIPRGDMEGDAELLPRLRAAHHGWGLGVADGQEYAVQVEKREEDAARAAAEIPQGDPPFFQIGFDDRDWETAEHPYTQFGIVLGRRQVELPEAWAGHDFTLALRTVFHFDQVWWDGEWLGGTPFTPGSEPRETGYTLPARLATPGVHLVALRIVVNGEHGGLLGPGVLEISRLSLPDVPPLRFQYDWKTRVERTLRPTPKPIQLLAGNLFNGMIAPLTPMPICGCIWYQGESNCEQAALYRREFPLLIQAWRKRWGFDFPFLFVQLANFGRPGPENPDTTWAELRAAQAACLSVPNTGMASAIDVGEADDIHPRDKRTVGERLAAVALRTAYGDRARIARGPRVEGAVREGSGIRVRFTGARGGLTTTDGEPPPGFKTAGVDGVFREAAALLDGEEVLVAAPGDLPVTRLRYAWSQNPRCTLRNREGFPAEPFSVAVRAPGPV